METFSPIEFHKTRDFSKKMNATFEFVKQNWKSLGTSILFIAGPPVLVASLIFGSFFGDLFTLGTSAVSNPEAFSNYFLSVSFWLQMLLALVFLIMSAVMTIATINNYLVLYAEKQTNRIDVKDVWDRVRATFWMYFRTMFLFILVAMGLYFLMIIPAAIMAYTSPGLIFLGILIMFTGFMYLMVAFSLTFVIRAFENRRFFPSLGRSLSLIRGKWWSTFGLIMVLYIIMMVISYIPIIPFYAVMLTTVLHNVSEDTAIGGASSSSMQIMTMGFFTIYYMFQMILSALPNIGIAFQYFNLVEMKESKGLLERIETFGDSQPPLSTPEEQY